MKRGSPIKNKIKNILLILVGFTILITSFCLMCSLFEEKHKTQFELCEKEARSRYVSIIKIVDASKQQQSKDQDKDFFVLVDLDMPIITVKTVDYQGKVTAQYKNDKIVVIRNISGLESFISFLVSIMCVVIYIFTIYYICSKKKAL